MLTNVSILIPYRPDGGHRDRLFDWVTIFYRLMMPEVELCIGLMTSEDFSRSRSINLAAKKATRDIFVIADADILYDPAMIIESIRLLKEYAWVIPHSKIINLTPEKTQELLLAEPRWPFPINIEGYERAQLGHGGINVLPRKHFNTVGGFDERFVGWGGEDDAFAASMNCLCGWHTRTDYTVYHMDHPAQVLGENYEKNIKLMQRYFKGKEEIERLIKERQQ